MNKDQIQQGDVLLRIVAALPEGCKRLKTKQLPTGEHTGHHHSFEEDSDIALMEAPDGRIFAVNEGSETEKLVHQEHNVTTLQPGEIAEFGQVLEKNWFNDMVAPVVD
jgi:hypothetical protein